MIARCVSLPFLRPAVEIRAAFHYHVSVKEEFSLTVDGVTEERLKLLVERFYERVRQDPLIGPVFNDAIEDWPEHLEKLQAFWSSVMLSSGRYKGRPLPAHARHGQRISAASFDRWLTLWHETTERVMPPRAAAIMQEKAARIAESLSLGIAFAWGEGARPFDVRQ